MMKLIIAFALLGLIAATSLRPPVIDFHPSWTEKQTHKFVEGFFEGITISSSEEGYKQIMNQNTAWGSSFEKVLLMFAVQSEQGKVEALANLGLVMWGIEEKVNKSALHEKMGYTIHKMREISFKLAQRQGHPNLIASSVNPNELILDAIKANQKGEHYTAGQKLGEALLELYFNTEKATSPEFAAFVNSLNPTWEATTYSKFEQMSTARFRDTHLGGRKKRVIKPHNKRTSLSKSSKSDPAPTAFDSREKWPKCVHAIRHQDHCGSCWAFAGSEVLSDRFCIASNQTKDAVLSPQYMVSCDPKNFGCNGGYLDLEWEFLEQQGTVEDTCWPYESGQGFVPSCLGFSACKDGKEMHFYKAVLGSSQGIMDTEEIKAELVANGPMETAFMVFEDFKAYKSGIYKHTTGAQLGGHAVKLVGYGVEGDTSYWICANSWDETWGEKGFFRIAFGQVGIDDEAIAGLADLIRS